MSDIADWLLNHGLEKYTETFIANDIDFDILASLTDEDLIQLGLSLGHRIRYRKAVAAMVSASDVQAEAGNRAARFSGAERRQLTVVFVDMVGSTSLSYLLDPEDLRALMLTYQTAVANKIEAFGGMIARYMGDGVLAYFGWPAAFEDASERAVHAALATVSAVAELVTPAGDALEARVGIATGLVVVGDLMGSGAAREQAVVGETPNLAARLQGEAQPNEILICNTTKKLLGQHFNLAHPAPIKLKGVPELTLVARVLGVNAQASRYLMQSDDSLRLLGRDQELLTLNSAWRSACTGKGQMLIIQGEAGIGKSGLMSAFLQNLPLASEQIMLWQCSPYHTDTAFYPPMQQIRTAHIHSHTLPAQNIDELEALAEQSALSPETRRAAYIRLLRDRVLQLITREPALLFIEDAHWIDPSTLELIDLLQTELSEHPLLVVITARNEFTPVHGSHVKCLELVGIDQPAARKIVKQVAGRVSLPNALIERIVQKTDGIPLFIEEMTKDLIDSGQLVEATENYQQAEQSDVIDVPLSLQGALLSRIDRLGVARLAVQCAACIGREFDIETLTVICTPYLPTLDTALDSLRQAGLIFTNQDQRHYQFKHALVRDVAYESLLKSQRRKIHLAIGQHLDTKYTADATVAPEVIAYHYTHAMEHERSITFWQVAGDQAVSRGANPEATAHYENAMKQLNKQPHEEKRDHLEFKLLTRLITPLVAARDFVNPTAVTSVGRACELGVQLGMSASLYPILYMQYVQSLNYGKYKAAAIQSSHYLELAERAHNPAEIATGLQMQGNTEYIFGRLNSAQAIFEQSLAIYRADVETNIDLTVPAYPNAKVNTSIHLARVLFIQGYPDQAYHQAHLGIAQAKMLGHRFSEAIATLFAGVHLCQYARDYEGMREHTEHLLKISAEDEFGFFFRSAQASIAWLDLMQGKGRASVNLACIEALYQYFIESGNIYQFSVLAANLTESYSLLGDHDKAIKRVDMALQLAEKTGERWCLPELNRLKAETLQKLPGPSANNLIEECYWLALQQAQTMNAKSWELRTILSFSDWRCRQETSKQTYEMLQSIYSWFTEGSRGSDQKTARARLRCPYPSI